MGGNRNRTAQQNETDELCFPEEHHGHIKNSIDCSHGKENKLISPNYKGNVKPGLFLVDFSVMKQSNAEIQAGKKESSLLQKPDFFQQSGRYQLHSIEAQQMYFNQPP